MIQASTHLILEECKRLVSFKTLSAEELDLKMVDQDRFIVRYKAGQDCQLKDFIEHVGLAYEKGCVFYEFTHYETISTDKEFIFMLKVFLL